MKRKQDGLVPIGEVFGDLGGPVKEIREATPQALHHFSQFRSSESTCLGQRNGP